MATLQKCVYCNRDISSSFEFCPHCQKIVHREVSCQVCLRSMNTTEAAEECLPDFIHSNCYEEVLKETKCIACKKVFDKETQEIWTETLKTERPWVTDSCLNCGHKYVYQRHKLCASCHRVLIIDNSVVEKNPEGASYFHHICFERHKLRKAYNKAKEGQQQAKNEQMRQQRKQLGLCSKCGENLSFWDKLFGREEHQGQNCKISSEDSPQLP